MKEQSKMFNFRLPNNLRDYIKNKSSERNTNISQYIIDLITNDKAKSDSQIAGYLAFYTQILPSSEDSVIKMELKQKVIPVHLKDKFIEKFNGKLNNFGITELEIEEFLKANS